MTFRARAAALVLCVLSVAVLSSCAGGAGGSGGSSLPDWAKAYETELKKTMPADEDPTCCFSLVYIDEDDVPELVVQQGKDESAQAELYTFDGVGAVDLGSFGEWGQFSLLPKKNLFMSGSSDGGAVITTVFGIKDGKAVAQREFRETVRTEGDTLLEIDGKEVSEDEFVTEYKEYSSGDVVIAPVIGDAHTYPMTRDGVKAFAAAFGG